VANVASVVDELAAAVGAGSLRESAGKIVATPRTAEEIATIARFADERGLKIEIAGAGTKRGWGNPVDAEIVLETAALAGVREHSWQDLTATVGAGTTWAAMQRALAVHGQRVALDPLWPEAATVGGIIATNDSGALRLRYGSLRDLIIGMTVVLADGTIAHSGGKVVKNVAGYDLHKLMTGAFGTLGVIAEVTFRLHPVPAETRTWTVASRDAGAVGALMRKVLDSRLSTEAMQMRAGAEGYSLDVRLATLPEVCEEQVASLEGLSASAGLAPGASARHLPSLSFPKGICGLPGTGDVDMFGAREALFIGDGGVIVKATMLPSSIAKLSEAVVRVGGEAVTQATGIMIARFGGEPAESALASLRGQVKGAGDGSVTVLRGPESMARWGGAEALPLMREIKRRFDPHGTLNAGRFVGGI